jgi:hypothetical protein
MTDLFTWSPGSEPVTAEEFRKAHPDIGRKSPKPSGHAAQPGTGPKGETCGSCAWLYRKRLGKTYRKCGLMEQHWTGGYGTDVRAKDPACSKWERPKE